MHIHAVRGQLHIDYKAFGGQKTELHIGCQVGGGAVDKVTHRLLISWRGQQMKLHISLTWIIWEVKNAHPQGRGKVAHQVLGSWSSKTRNCTLSVRQVDGTTDEVAHLVKFDSCSTKIAPTQYYSWLWQHQNCFKKSCIPWYKSCTMQYNQLAVKKVHRNIYKWGLVLKISSRGFQR